MNKYAQNLFLSLGMLATASVYSQCDIDFDFGDAEFGVSPDPLEDESFETVSYTHLRAHETR